MCSKIILIIYPHWMPSNLVGAQRARLLCNYFEEFGWKPIVLAVNPACYDEPLVPELTKLVNEGVEVHYVNVHPRTGIYKLLGDLTLRGYSQIRDRAIEIIKTRNVDFVWLPIPSFYNALLGRPINRTTGVKYGIDYIDPWVDGFAHQERLFSKAWCANQLAKVLEPYAVKNASLITGVTYNYYAPVLDRNFKNNKITHCAFQYGFDPHDFEVIPEPFVKPWDRTREKPLIYAGAFLPKSHIFIQLLFKSISKLRRDGQLDSSIRLYFIGTLQYQGTSIIDYAKEYGIEDIVVEIRERMSYLQILQLLKDAFGIMVIGSTDKHYSASKVFQALLSNTPVFSIFHTESEATRILEEVKANNYLVKYSSNQTKDLLEETIKTSIFSFLNQDSGWNPNLNYLTPYSSRESVRVLIQSIEKVIS